MTNHCNSPTFCAIEGLENRKIWAHEIGSLFMESSQYFFVGVTGTQEQPQSTKKNLSRQKNKKLMTILF